MKRRNSKNRHFSKGVNKSHKRTIIHKGEKRKETNSSNAKLAVRSFKWSRMSTIIQFADFLIDQGPRLARWLFFLLGMG